MKANLHTIHSNLVKAIAIVLGLGFIAVYLFMTLKRVIYPYEIEWMEGSFIEGSVRILHGLPLYVRPTIHYVPWLYQPLFSYLTAVAMMLVGPTCSAGRLVAFISTMATAVLVGSAAYRLSDRSRLSAFFAFALYLAAYGATAYSFDIVRPDPLFIAFLVLAVYVLLFMRRGRGAIVAGALLALAVLSKQQAVYYVVPIGCWLLLGSKRQALWFAIAFAAIWLLGTAIFYHLNGDWYFYYVYGIPRAKAADFHTGRMIFTFSWIVFASWGVGSICVAAACVATARGLRNFLQGPNGLLAILLLTATAHVMIHLGDMLSHKNSAMAFAAFIAIALPVCMHQIAERVPQAYKSFLVWPIVLQLLGMFYDPKIEGFGLPTAGDVAGAHSLMATIETLDGPVYIRNHSLSPYLHGKDANANELAVADVLSVGDDVAKQLKTERDSAFRAQAFDYIITDEGFFRVTDSIPGYSLFYEINNGKNIYRSYVGANPSFPRYVLISDRARQRHSQHLK